MLAIGFDLSFVDTLVRVENKLNDLEVTLPPPGFHHRSSSIHRVAGGNGVNIAATLVALGVDLQLVVPVDPDFKQLLSKRAIYHLIPIHADINNSVGITWKQGDIQFNDVKATLAKENWTKEVHDAWVSSPIAVFTNWSLNSGAAEWVSCQVLALLGYSHKQICSLVDPYNELQGLSERTITKPCFLEPGSIKHHPDKEKLCMIIPLLNKFVYSKNLSFLCFNQEESSEFLQLKFYQKVFHSKSFIRKYKSSEIVEYVVPTLTTQPKTFVGAGDAFSAGIILSILNKSSLQAVEYGISVAHAFLHGTLSELQLN